MAKQRLTVKSLAEQSNVSRATIAAIRSGKSCSKLTGMSIARALGVDPAELIEEGAETHE